MLDLPGVAAHFAISSFFEGYRESDSIYSYGADLQKVQRFEEGKLILSAGRARITSRTTHAFVDFDFAVLYAGGHSLRAGIAPAHRDFAAFIEQLRGHLSEGDFNSFSPILEHYFGQEIYSLKSLFHDERRRIVSQIVDSKLADIDRLYGAVYEENISLIGFLREIGMPLPRILRVSSEFVLNNEICRCLESEELDLSRMNQLLHTNRQHGISFDAKLPSAFHRRVESLMNGWKQSPLDLKALAQLQPLVELMRVAPFEADMWTAQNSFYEVMTSVASRTPSDCSPEWIKQFRRLGESLGISVPKPFPAVVAPEKPVSAPVRLSPNRSVENMAEATRAPNPTTIPFDAAVQ
jgi:hypothetical protein